MESPYWKLEELRWNSEEDRLEFCINGRAFYISRETFLDTRTNLTLLLEEWMERLKIG